MWKKITISIFIIAVFGFILKFALPGKLKPQPAETTNCDSLFEQHILNIYKEAGLDSAKMNFDLFRKGMTGYYNLMARDQIDKPILSLIDFSLPSTLERLWVVDVYERKLLFNSLVAHGQNTGELFAQQFSNNAESHMSSLGFYTTSSQYNGKHGLSLVLDGVEEGFNDNARSRAVVIHSADYVSENVINAVGRLGRSHGCPAIPQAICEDLICTICDRSALFVYFPDANYLANSKYLEKSTAIMEFQRNSPEVCPGIVKKVGLANTE
ncbi:MAG: murein L,D-transpeptidase catalytic domain family protein [Bacteroidota bacterium]|nr:murein L,D-transpeptidase catalytic domain family protein [Bacteroidota bacterium]